MSVLFSRVQRFTYLYLFSREFTKKASIEIEYFQKQKDKDLHESLVNFITLQVKAAKKVGTYL
jgi:hypothetical protein